MLLQLPVDVEIKIADSIGKCNQYGLEILDQLKNSFSGYLAVGFDTENPVSFIPNRPQPHVYIYIYIYIIYIYIIYINIETNNGYKFDIYV